MSGPYPDRRELLAYSAVGALTAGLRPPLAAAGPHKKYAFKKSINQWAFPYPEKMSLEQCLKLAKEAGFDAKTGKDIVRIDPRYFRPTEVDELLGDASKARAQLGWKPKVTFAELVAEMVESDRTAVEQETARNDRSAL